ncbi:NAD(P)-dependent dehydrogenase (short-subunit alcohol dehydrogenase family) [Hamadaea flava]|uniref:SDR family oxidoreductase n=1 Tax=Hamadaea flava TaxID=1742688 RepID=A0ABV8LK73_9ACTN|nr:SDR family NAD(P)-dependent oxidoreductase [Hamadaea flava]MCP2323831.1 NAD(P)-dependent dehydrogenase (short-subunit alcohol dehydrogenase family) [Hamadaea flava]
MAHYKPTDGIVVVTGGASGIGLALAQRFAADGARVVLADLDGARAARAAYALGEGHGGIGLDVTDEEAVARAVDRIEDELGPIGIWCSNAGVATPPGLGTDSDWELAWGVHVLAHLYAARTVLPRMVERGRGHFLVTASAAGLLTELDVAAYAVSKHGAVALAEWLAIRYGGDTGVTFSCLCPQGVRTPLLDGAPADSATLAAAPLLEPAEVADRVVEAIDEGRFLILPHPEVAQYSLNRVTDTDRWLGGMRKLYRRLHP